MNRTPAKRAILHKTNNKRGYPMRKISLLAVLSLLSMPSFAAQFGLGADIGGASLYFPIRTENFIFEPFVDFFDRDESEQETGEPVPDTFGIKSTLYGLGIFRVSPASETISLYYGGRAGISKSETKSSSSFGSLSSEQDGAFIAPVLGLAYSPISNVSIAVEHEISFFSGDVEITSTSVFDDSAEGDTDQKTSHTAVVLRIFLD
jgi:hypothetical protein